jgi:cytoskeletal protein RodZ
MTALDEVIGNALNDAILANAASGTSNLKIGSVQLTAPYTVLFDATRGTASVTGTAITGTSSTTLAGKVATASASVSHVPTKANDAIISITTSASGTWNGIRVQDSTGTPQRVLYGPTSDLSKAFGSGDILSLPIGNLTLTTG